jgi:AcrR family transcriptional regulator
MEPARADQRRATGERTRTRLMEAALDLIAERGEEGVTLRELTDAADANVAAVSYHFGALKSLCDAAIDQALEHYLDAQEAAVRALPPEATLEELAAAFARPMISALTKGGRDRAVIRIVARAGIDPPEGWGRLDARFDQIRRDVLAVLKANLPGVRAPDLIFRTRCAAGMLNWLALARVGNELRDKSEKQAERLLVPIVAGAFRGTSSA